MTISIVLSCSNVDVYQYEVSLEIVNIIETEAFMELIQEVTSVYV